MEIDLYNITFDLNYESSEDEKQDRPTFKQEESASVSRCVSISADDLDSIERSRHEANTVKQTSWAVNCFKTWISERKIKIDLKNILKSEFGAILRELHATIRTTKGEMYCISSYAGLRAGLNRYINEPPFGRMWNMMQDTEFTAANNVFKGFLKQMRKAGTDKSTHHPPISSADQAILKGSDALHPSNPRSLLNKVWFDIQLHFGRRGSEGNRHLKPDSFVLKK